MYNFNNVINMNNINQSIKHFIATLSEEPARSQNENDARKGTVASLPMGHWGTCPLGFSKFLYCTMYFALGRIHGVAKRVPYEGFRYNF